MGVYNEPSRAIDSELLDLSGLAVRLSARVSTLESNNTTNGTFSFEVTNLLENEELAIRACFKNALETSNRGAALKVELFKTSQGGSYESQDPEMYSFREVLATPSIAQVRIFQESDQPVLSDLLTARIDVIVEDGGKDFCFNYAAAPNSTIFGKITLLKPEAGASVTCHTVVDAQFSKISDYLSIGVDETLKTT